jgi:hypothetical protein
VIRSLETVTALFTDLVGLAHGDSDPHDVLVERRAAALLESERVAP